MTTSGSHGRNGLPAMSSDDQQQSHLDRELHAGVEDIGEDKDFAGECNPTDQSGVHRDRAQPERGDEPEEVPREETAEEVEGEAVQSRRVTDRCRCVEQRAEHEAVDEDLRQRVEHRPRPTEERAAVLGAELTKREIPQQLS